MATLFCWGENKQVLLSACFCSQNSSQKLKLYTLVNYITRKCILNNNTFYCTIYEYYNKSLGLWNLPFLMEGSPASLLKVCQSPLLYQTCIYIWPWCKACWILPCTNVSRQYQQFYSSKISPGMHRSGYVELHKWNECLHPSNAVAYISLNSLRSQIFYTCA